MKGRFELGESRVEIVFERLPQANLIGVRVVGTKHASGKSVEAERIVISPGHCETERLGKLLQIDQRWTGIDPDCLPAVEKFAGVTSRHN